MELIEEAESLLAAYRRSGKKLVTAESCTGGLITATLTAVAGSSEVVERGFVTYSNAAKSEVLGVPAEMIAQLGAVSGEVAEAMAAGALARSHADVAVSVTGVAGPGGATRQKPVGLVYLGWSSRHGPPRFERHSFDGDRTAVRLASLAAAFAKLRAALEE